MSWAAHQALLPLFLNDAGPVPCVSGSPQKAPQSSIIQRPLRTHRSQRHVSTSSKALLVVGTFISLKRLCQYQRLCRRNPGRISSLTLEAWRADNSCELPDDLDIHSIEASQQSAGLAKVALILNRNAKGVSSAVERKLRQIVGPANCFECCTEEDAAAALQEVVDRGHYKAVACGGGDGTIASVLNLLSDAAAKSGKANELPALCVLRLGTGNALAYVVGARKQPLEDLERLVNRLAATSEVPSVPCKILSLRTFKTDLERSTDDNTEADSDSSEKEKETLCFFAGLGYDARLLRDYNKIKKRTKNTLFRKWVHSPLGYIIALLTRTLPATMRREHVFHVRITNLHEDAFYIDPRRGDWVSRCEKGSILYDGEAGIVSFGAVPFYGGGFHLFPFACMSEGLAHLRLSCIHPAQATLNVFGIWWGSYRNYEKVKDFLVKDVLVEVDRPTPLQHSGELVGDVTRLQLEVRSDGTTRLVDFIDDWDKK